MSMKSNMFMLMILFFILFSVSSSTWWSMWVGMELTGFMFSCWLAFYETPKMKLKVFIYFIIQLISSSAFFMSNIMMSHLNNSFMVYLNSYSLMMKMGGFPFHTWMFSIIENLDYKKFFFLMTMMKLIPMAAMNMTEFTQLFLLTSLGGMFLAPSSYQLGSLRLILTYSSIIHISWMILALKQSKFLFLFYFSCYMILMFVIIKILILQFNKMSKLKELMSIYLSPSTLMIWLISIYSMIGIPPFLMFYPKFWVINFLMESNQWIYSLIIIIMSFLPVYFYSKFVFMVTLNTKMMMKHYFYKKVTMPFFFFFFLIFFFNYLF
uniref:NADH dehydrogenase subunit 2 n=1 Tax=Laemobothrion tinnunculi TaxID=1941263 RepID=UPI0021D5388C|nr:NADH dehydrogenase subunit 2 [Laemobothrion tinnunculi]UXC94707.1 NADH dehydrogenase subunit 2 [Laemobothrion tinnunculi]UXC94722.1 NADH dehydrogenase subunit 2 [Laemobothrion tinnunculi]